jgi:putative Mg2+ transporter-C (MgtC) family protein
MTEFQILAYVAVAMLLGALIGLEREFKDKPAGLRTHMLVAGAAALLLSLATW